MVLLLVVLAAIATSAVGCGGGGDTAPSAAERDRQLLGETSLSGLHSGYFEATFFLDNETLAEAVQWRATGPFIRSGGTLRANVRWEFPGSGAQTRGTLQVLGDQTTLGSGGKSYFLPTSEQASPGNSNCRRSLEGIDFNPLVKGLSIKPEPVGESTIEGTLRLDALLGALHRLTVPSACGSLLEEAGVAPAALGALEAEVESTFKKSEAKFTFDKDHVLTGISLGIWVETPPPGQEEIDGIFTVYLSRINEIGQLGAAPSAKRPDVPVREASVAQRSRVESWIGLVDAAFGALGGGS